MFKSELMKPKSCKEKTMLTKPRCTGKRDESRGMEKFMLCQYYGTIEGIFILDCSTLKVKLRNIAHKLSWDHVGSCDLCDHSFRLWDNGKSHLAQDLTHSVMVYSALFFNFF